MGGGIGGWSRGIVCMCSGAGTRWLSLAPAGSTPQPLAPTPGSASHHTRKHSTTHPGSTSHPLAQYHTLDHPKPVPSPHHKSTTPAHLNKRAQLGGNPLHGGHHGGVDVVHTGAHIAAVACRTGRQQCTLASTSMPGGSAHGGRQQARCWGLDMQQGHPMGTHAQLNIGTADCSPCWARARIISLPKGMCKKQS